MNWAFDCKDSAYSERVKGKERERLQKKQAELEQKFGNFNTPIVMKLCSKFNKRAQSERMTVNPVKVAQRVAQSSQSLLSLLRAIQVD
mmetsp:Transcript_6195/g.10525  ORF Transcript_6195/g.10525 Transcript_6195/m.10525 type:complete len:88 (+) Transcript_6195:46-309(+)